MDISRIQRLMRLIVVLQTSSSQTVADLMKELNVSRRTLFRDLDVLKAAGIPIYHDRDRGYRINQSFYLKPVNLTVPETLGLMLLTKHFAGRANEPLVGPAIAAIYKLLTTVPEPLRSACSEMMANVTVEHAPKILSDGESKFYACVSRCIDERRVVRFNYQGPLDDKPLAGKLQPYLLHFSNRAWYVLGHSDTHNEVRMFKLMRFMSMSRTEQRFNRPARFNATDKLGGAWQMIPEGKLYTVELIFSARVATNVAEVQWHRSQRHDLLKDGRCKMTFRVDGLDEISWWVCGYADQVEVVRPPKLRQIVRQMHDRASDLNG